MASCDPSHSHLWISRSVSSPENTCPLRPAGRVTGTLSISLQACLNKLDISAHRACSSPKSVSEGEHNNPERTLPDTAGPHVWQGMEFD